MKCRLSLKGKLTITYTALMTVMVALVMVFLFYMSNRQSLQELQRRLEEEVTDEAGEISYDRDDGTLEFDSDFMELENGVYLSAYSAEGVFLYGRVPYDFDFYTGLIPGSTRKAEGGTADYYVMDLAWEVDGYGELIVRGVISIDEAVKTFSTNLQFAAAVLPVFIVLAAILAWSMTKRALRPVATITRTVQSIREDGDLSRRIALGEGGDEIHEMAATFDNLLDEVEQSMRREQQFTSDVSHELRTPVMAIQLWCGELLAEPELSPEVRSGLLKLQERVDYLSKMISQLLFISRADQGRQPVEKEKLDFSELTEMAADSIADIAAEKRITVHRRIQSGIFIDGDQTLLIRLWMNLLENAVSYEREGGSIWISLVQDEERISGEVRDDGIGINAEDLEHIWERFYRAEESRSSTGSSGLGLSMAKWIVQVHGGEITATSTPGMGSAFCFVFTAHRSTDASSVSLREMDD